MLAFNCSIGLPLPANPGMVPTLLYQSAFEELASGESLGNFVGSIAFVAGESQDLSGKENIVAGTPHLLRQRSDRRTTP